MLFRYDIMCSVFVSCELNRKVSAVSSRVRLVNGQSSPWRKFKLCKFAKQTLHSKFESNPFNGFHCNRQHNRESYPIRNVADPFRPRPVVLRCSALHLRHLMRIMHKKRLKLRRLFGAAGVDQRIVCPSRPAIVPSQSVPIK